MSLKTVSTQRPQAPPSPATETHDPTVAWIEALELAQGILHDAAQAPRAYVQRLHVEKGGE